MAMVCSVQQKRGESVAQGIGGWRKKNWLLSKSLPKVIGRGFDYTVLVNMVQAPWMLENDIFLEL